MADKLPEVLSVKIETSQPNRGFVDKALYTDQKYI